MAEPNCGDHVREHPIQWKEFEDGLPNIFIDNVLECTRRRRFLFALLLSLVESPRWLLGNEPAAARLLTSCVTLPPAGSLIFCV